MGFITKDTYKYMKYSLEPARWLFSHPYIWVGNGIEIGKSRFRLAVFYVHTAIVVTYNLFLYVRTIQVFMDDSASTVLSLQMVNMCMAYLLHFMMQINIFLRLHEIPVIFNGFLRFLREVEDGGIVGHLDKSVGKKAELFYKYLYHICILNTIVMICFIVFLPKAPYLISSVLGTSGEWGVFNRLISIAFHVYIITSFGNIVQVMMLPEIVFISSAQELIGKLLSAMKTSEEVESAIMLQRLRAYRCLDALVKYMWNVYMIAARAGHLVMVSAVIFFTCTCFHLDHGIISIVSAVLALDVLVLLEVMLSFYAGINTRSEELLQHVQHACYVPRSRASWFRREVKSLPVLRVWLGSRMYYDKELVLTTMEIVSDTTVSFLLMA